MTQTLASRVDPGFIETLLQPLIRLDTENPPGNEQPATHLVDAYLAAAGFETREIVTAPGRSNLLAIARGERPGPTILLNGHLDTQPLARETGWTMDPCSGHVVDGRIWGRGTGDMKSGVAAMAAGSAAFLAAGRDFAGTLVMLASADETSGGYLGVGAVLEELRALQPSMAVIGEPTLGDIGIGHRGACWVEITVQGRAGQAGKTHTGVNAISVAAELISALEGDLPASFPKDRSAWLPAPTLNIGTIEGGIKPNVIPQFCRFVVDRRVTLGETEADVMGPIRQIAERVAAARSAQVTFRTTMFVPASEVGVEESVVAACDRAFREIIGRPAKIRGLGGFTDAHFLVDGLGVPTINFGPWYLTPNPAGSFSDIPDEYGLIDEIVTGAQVYERLLTILLRA